MYHITCITNICKFIKYTIFDPNCDRNVREVGGPEKPVAHNRSGAP